MLYSVYSCILCFQTYSLGTMWRFFFLNSDSGRVACRNNRSACPQKFNGFGLVPRDLSWLIIVHLTYEYLLIFAEHLRLLSRYPISCHLNPLDFRRRLCFAARCQRECLRNSMHRGIEAQVDCIPTIFDVRTLRDRCFSKVTSCSLTRCSMTNSELPVLFEKFGCGIRCEI